MKLNSYHAGVLDSCPPLPKPVEKDGPPAEDELKTRFQPYYLDGISQEQLEFLNKYCTPSSTDDVDAKLVRTVNSLQAKVRIINIISTDGVAKRLICTLKKFEGRPPTRELNR